MEPPKDKKEYAKWYYQTVTKPKRDAQQPEKKKIAPMRKLGAPTTRKCEFPACENEFVSNKPERHYCSAACSIKHRFDIKHGVSRGKNEDYCPGCEKVYHFSKFPVDIAAVSGRSSYCRDCHNQKVRETNKKGYKVNPQRFLQVQKRYNDRKKVLTHNTRAQWAGNARKPKPPATDTSKVDQET